MDLSLTLCYLLQRILIPLTLVTAVIFRQNLLSGIYLVFLLLTPWLPPPSPENVIKGINGIYLRLLIGASSLINVSHIIFQIVLLVATHYPSSVDYCTGNGQIWNLIGLHRYNDVSFFNIVRLCCLDFFVLMVGCLVYIFAVRTYTAKLSNSRENLAERRLSQLERRITDAGFNPESSVARYLQNQLKRRQKRDKAERLSYAICEAIFFVALCASAILEPSMVASVYFLYFLFIGTWFAFDRRFGHGYHYFRVFIAIFSGVHFACLFLYQFLLIQPVIPPGHINARLFGLVEYVRQNCTTVRTFVLNDYHFVRFLHPFVLLVLYFVSVYLVRAILIDKKLFLQIFDVGGGSGTGYLVLEKSYGSGSPIRHSPHFPPEEQRITTTESIHLNYAFVGPDTPLLAEVAKTRPPNVSDQTPLLQNSSSQVQRSYSAFLRSNSTDHHHHHHQHQRYSQNQIPVTPVTSRGGSSDLVPGGGTCSAGPGTPAAAAVTKSTHGQFSLFCFELIRMVKCASYVITLIVMMTWSITYHSWLSFVFLLSSCIIWMTPNSRQTCLNSSPIIVFYAIIMVIGQYIFSLNLTDRELPVMVAGVSISEIGFKKYGEFSYQPLFVKLFYTAVFWVTLRQYSEMMRDVDTPATAASADIGIFSPLFNIGTGRGPPTTPATDISYSTAQSKLFDSMMKQCKAILIKYWIWIVAVMLMVMSLSGSKVVIYRIVYMFLFLVFTWLLLISLKWWRKLIYPFWLIVILYSMIILIAIYTYQFNNFPDYWERYLMVDKELQEDLGLVVYDNDAFVLFKALLTPTFFIIITIIQVHFVHKDFLEFSNIDEILDRLNQQHRHHHSSDDFSGVSTMGVGGTGGESDTAAAATAAVTDIKVDVDLKSQPSQSELSVQTVISREKMLADGDDQQQPQPAATATASAKTKPTLAQEMQHVLELACQHIRRFIHQWMVVFWRLLEVHIMKFVFLCAILIAVRDISVMNVVFVFLSIFLMVFNRFEKIVCFIFAIWSGILVMLKMLFQLNIAQRIEWHTNCTLDTGDTEVIDNRSYIGFLRVDDIFSYIWEYIVLLIILVFRTVILSRQYLYRRQEYGDEEPLLDGVIFPDVDRSVADKDFGCFLKYLLNYGFYKFGVEICLILTTVSIGNHGDIFSVLYCLLLTLFVLFNRLECQKYWAWFVGFMAVALPYQYLMCLGIPPGLCLHYPWRMLPPSELEWYFLPDFKHPLPKEKLYLDFLLLFFLCRQWYYFRLEPKLIRYGGSNIEAYKESTPQTVFDFFSFGTSLFDTFKSYFLFCFFWITLAVLFLAGTTRINLFGLGYVLGSFIFLWNGNEFYLKPVKMIFKLFKIIIGYTCMTMLLKSIVQMFVLTMLKHKLCWLVQLLGISYHPKETVEQSVQELITECPTTEAGLLWDGICFTFLLIQKRIFCSHYFKYLIREIKAQQFLASRGAELIHEIQAQEVADQEVAEREVMEKIKQKMDRIKEAQQKMFANKARSIKYHKQAVKSGGYYMFEDLDTEAVDLNHKCRESLIPDPEGNEMKNLAKSKGFTTFCSKIFKGEEETAALVSSEITADVGESSHDSAIVSVERRKLNPDSSRPTTMTSVPASQDTDISNMSTLASCSSGFMAAPPPPPPPPQSEPEMPSDERKSSHHEDDDQYQPPEMTYVERIKSWFDFFKRFAESIFISSTSNLNSVSRDYRFVAKRLSVEKKCLKKIIEIKELEGIRHDFISDPQWKRNTLAKLSKLTEEELENVCQSDPHDVLRTWNQLDESVNEGNQHLYLVSLDSKYLDTSIYVHFFRAIFYAILSRSEVICYITIVINQITSASVLSLPLPLLAFLWGSLSVPRPSKSFWVTCITYIEIVVVLKYVFQFHFWRWNDLPKPSPFWWPRLLGIEKKDNYANYDLVLLLVLFFHRFMLKSLGLWDLSETEIKAYMTNAELFQSNKNEDDLVVATAAAAAAATVTAKTSLEAATGNHKKIKSSKKKQKRSTGSKTPKAVSSDESIRDHHHQQLQPQPSSESETGAATAMVPAGRPLDFGPPAPSLSSLENELLTENVDDDDFNIIYVMMMVPAKIKKRFKALVKPVYKFFHNVLHPPYRITRDVYSLMFLCDFINFFILVFGFYAFGSGYSGSEDVARFLEENKIPIGFLITLLIQFAQIIVDRAIYLRKYIKGKLIFQIIIVIFTHMWLFFVLPAMTDKVFTDKTNLPPKLWYIFKCIYFLLSAYQIRSGYPTRILGNTFCKKYNFVNWYLFKIYMLIPFVYDLRMYMDWIWTDTSLVLDEWSLMEDIFVNLYQRKCELKLDEEFPEPRGKAKKRFFKYLIGGSWVIIIIALIWGPLVLFAFGRAVGEVNRPIGATFELEIGGYQPLFKMSVTDNALEEINDQNWAKLSASFGRDSVAQTFISGYDQQDVYVVNLNGNSTAVWGISPPSQKILQTELLSNRTTLFMKLTYYLMRKKTKTQDMDTTIYDEHLIELDPVRDYGLRRQLSEMISNPDEQQPAVIPRIFPNYLRAPEKGKPLVVNELLPKNIQPLNKTLNFRNILIQLKKGNYQNNTSTMTSWWEIHDDCQNVDQLDQFFRDLLKSEGCQYLPVVVFSDKVFIGLLAFLSGYGIIGIYTTFVFLVSRWVRGLNSESSFKVIYTRMPNVDRVLQLCLDIYLVRESREFELEEDLYAKLIFLYRSPETLIKWTKINEAIQNVPDQPAGNGRLQ